MSFFARVDELVEQNELLLLVLSVANLMYDLIRRGCLFHEGIKIYLWGQFNGNSLLDIMNITH